MEFEDLPLLHFADLVAALLRASHGQPGTLDAAARLLDHYLTAAHERPPVSPAEIQVRLARALDHLTAARLVARIDPGSFRITPRGRALLRKHASGIDDTVLMDFPEFRAWIDQDSRRPPPEDARRREFQRGWAAQCDGRDMTDNPYPADTAQHAAWTDGWLEARRR